MLTVGSYKWRISCLLLLVAVLLGACTPQEQELPFETIEQADYSPKYEDKEPGLVIIASADETNQLDGWVGAEVIEQLRKMDYGNYFAVVAFLGWQPTGHEGISIERVVRQGDEVFLYASVGRPKGTTEVTSPYHLIQVQKMGWWSTSINFALVVEETTVVSQSHYIP